MAKYTGIYSCGHEGTINLIGPNKDRAWKYDNEFSKMCPECYKQHLQNKIKEENELAAVKAKEMELPKLVGTEKQVVWATTIRQRFIDVTGEDIKATVKKYADWGGEIENLSGNELTSIRIWILENKTEARYWIDNRDKQVSLLFMEKANALKSNKEIAEEDLIKEIKIEATVKPKNAVTSSIAEITYDDKNVEVRFEKNDTFKNIVKGLGYKWKKYCWYKSIGIKTGTPEDRAAELGNKLLNNGFPILILDPIVRHNAINGIYEVEYTRWIMKRVSKNMLCIDWGSYDNRLYTKVISLPGAYWDNGVLINPSHYKEVEEFAKLYGFKFSKGALELIKEFKANEEKIKTIDPGEVKKVEYKDGLEEILKRNNDILTDLMDD